MDTPDPAITTPTPFSLHVPLTAKLLRELVYAAPVGVVIATVGRVLSMVMTALGPATLEPLLWLSVAVPAAMLTVRVPLPAQLCSVIVRPERPVPDKPSVQPWVPVTAVTVTSAKYSDVDRMLAAPV